MIKLKHSPLCLDRAAHETLNTAPGRVALSTDTRHTQINRKRDVIANCHDKNSSISPWFSVTSSAVNALVTNVK